MKPNADLPDVAAVVPLIPQVVPAAQNLYREQFIKPLELVEFVKKTQPIHLARLDNPKNPLVKIDSNDNESLILMWGHPKNYLDTNFLVAMICPLKRDSKGVDTYKPSMMIRGPLANVMVVGGMSCCGSALQAHWSQVLEGGKSIDEARTPVAGLPNPEQANWLKGKIHLAQTSASLTALHDMAMDMLAHRLPNDPRFKRSQPENNYMANFDTLRLGH